MSDKSDHEKIVWVFLRGQIKKKVWPHTQGIFKKKPEEKAVSKFKAIIPLKDIFKSIIVQE